MSQIGNRIIITAALSGNLIIRWVKASAPLAEVGRNDNPSLLTFPYDDTYLIEDLQPVVYLVQLWRSDDGIALDQLLTEWAQDASQSGTGTIRTYQYVVDRGWTNVTQATGDEVWADPADLDVVLIDERLEGFTKDDLIVHEAGYGNRVDADYDLVSGGGIELLGGLTFNSGTSWFITVASTSAVSTSTTTSGAKYAGVQEITADDDFDDTLYNKLCPINGAGTFIQVNFPDLALIPDGTHATFNTHQGSQNYTRFQLDTGDSVRFMNADVNFFDVAKNETVDLYFEAGVCYVTNYDGNAMRRGSVMPDYDASRHTDLGNVIYADEATGVLDQADYEGLFAFVSQLSGDAVCALGTGVGQWSYDSGGGVYPNKRKYGISGTTFRVPHLSGMTAKYSATPGVYEADNVGSHSLTYDYKQGKSDDNESGVSGEYLRKAGAAGGTSYGNTSITYTIGAGENLVKSYSQKPYIYL